MIGAGLVSRLTVTPLLYVIGALLVALVASGGYAYKLRADVTTAQAATSVAAGERDTARGDADRASARAAELATAASGWQVIVGERGALLQACQAENARQRSAGDRAVANAKAKARDAERTLDAFTARYQVESRKPDCERARNAMAAACPALEDY